MKKIQIFLAAIVAVVMTSCVNFKTEATVDVKVLDPDGKEVGAGNPDGKEVGAGIVVYKFTDNGLGEGTTLYKDNASGSAKTNSGSLAHFDLKSPDDFTPSDIAGVDVREQNTFFFCTYDAEGTRNGFIAVTVKTGDNKTVTLKMEKPQQDE